MGQYITPHDVQTPVCWVIEPAAEDPTPMLINVSDFNSKTHALIDEAGNPVAGAPNQPAPPADDTDDNDGAGSPAPDSADLPSSEDGQQDGASSTSISSPATSTAPSVVDPLRSQPKIGKGQRK